MKDPHIVFIDFDGTLISDKFEIPKENIEAIKQTREKGHKVFLNTGRSLANCPPELMEFSDCFDGFICGNGTYILYNGEVLRNHYLPFELLCSLFEYFFERPEKCAVFQSDDNILKTGANVDMFCPYGVNIRNLDELTQNFRDIKVNVFCSDGQTEQDFYDRFADTIEVYQCSTYSDCVRKGFSKADGVKAVTELLSLPIENTVAIGDSENDMPMFEICKISVAMGNSPQKIKDIATLVSASNNECGVAKALELLFLSK